MLQLMCLLVLTWPVLAEVPTDEERSTIIECHTKIREGVQPTASNMQLMNYSTDMENLAVKLVANCQIPSDLSPFQGKGYTILFEGNEVPQFADVICKVNGSNYNYEMNSCNGDCDEYKQMVWATSTQIGCASNKCANSNDASKSKYLMACVYNPGQEDLSGRPYESGPICSQCPQRYGCTRNQCDQNAQTTSSSTTISTTLSTLKVLFVAVLLPHTFK
uniref:SCP domain-containing protein n=1 Tax=Mesocestoides corti TaxID=53468 RepID=A0A5K3FWY0_MESCO